MQAGRPPGTGAGSSPERDLLERDLQIARQIQATFLPEELPRVAGWELAARFLPAREVAGDFYDAFLLVNNRRLGIVVADVCDKGVGAALFMALFRTLIRAFARQHYALSWADALSGAAFTREEGAAGGTRRRSLPSMGTGALKNAVALTNNYVLENHGQAGMFATLFFGVLDPATGSLSYVNCGHNPPLVIGPGGRKTRLAATGPSLGIMPEAEFDILQAEIESGGLLLAYTDGVTEARDPHGGFYSEARLLSLLDPLPPSAPALLATIEASVRGHAAGAEQSDDITMLALWRIAP